MITELLLATQDRTYANEKGPGVHRARHVEPGCGGRGHAEGQQQVECCRHRFFIVVAAATAARALGISLNKLKRACRQYGIPRWPYRQVRSIRSTIHSLKNALEKCDSDIERASLKDRLESLIKKESLVCKFASCGLTGPLRNMLFSSKPESICDVLIKDIVEQSGRPIGAGGAGQDQANVAGLKRRREQGEGVGVGVGMVGHADGMSMPPGYGSDKQHVWMPANMSPNMYRMPMGPAGGGHMPPPGMDMGMQYFMPPDSTGGMGYMDGSQHHHHAPGAGAQPQHQGQHPQQAQQQQLMLMQSNPGFAMQGGFVPVGYDLYSQAAPFAGAGMDGLSAGAPGAAHPLVPYMQGARIPGATGAGDAMRASAAHYPQQWHSGEAAGLGGNVAAILQQQQQQFMQQRRLHQQQIRVRTKAARFLLLLPLLNTNSST
ncbi:Putative NIN-like transcription factor [Ectocarpus siliculosus]|uniref:NIN-like transcription factor n=1 Tax=Ectocarpus siliculosus TaxID=2880 RepID=D8LRL6_ECTSI|nr:Putative NIN-like transcription factor [Ectocarpus siliculosus]|eukprot:CBN77777.1 Putative NIN-like transcription factor [Ectocarpus siliculosus]